MVVDAYLVKYKKETNGSLHEYIECDPVYAFPLLKPQVMFVYAHILQVVFVSDSDNAVIYSSSVRWWIFGISVPQWVGCLAWS